MAVGKEGELHLQTDSEESSEEETSPAGVNHVALSDNSPSSIDSLNVTVVQCAYQAETEV